MRCRALYVFAKPPLDWDQVWREESGMIRKAMAFYDGVVRDIEGRQDWGPGPLEDRSLELARTTALNMGGLLRDAQLFVLSDEVAELMSNLLTEMGEGASAMFAQTRLPFPVMWVEHSTPRTGETHGALIAQTPDMCLTSFMVEAEGRFFPALTSLHFEDGRGWHYEQPHYERAMRTGSAEDRAGYQRLKSSQEEMCMFYFGMAMGVATLLNYKGMLETEEAPAWSRQERRRAERSGKPLPETRICRITLGELGRAQRAAMDEEKADGEKIRKRAHWVRGHFMRTRSGGVSWRMPHVRGAGPLIGQRREVHLPSDPETNGPPEP